MGRGRRGLLWFLFPPAGAVASVRAGQRSDTDRLVRAVEHRQAPDPPSEPSVVERSPESLIRRAEVQRRKDEMMQRLSSAGFTEKKQRMGAYLMLLRLVGDEGKTVDEAVDALVRWRTEI